MSIAELLATKFLANSTTSRIDVELLLTFVLNQPRSFLYAHSEYELTKEQEKKFSGLLSRRKSGEPIAYILGKKEFWSLELTVNQSVLIPRPETELLVEIALNKLDHEVAVIADMGTGSGAIALALAAACPKWIVVATDISTDALNLARYNARQLQLNNIDFYCGDWCMALPSKKFDLIISNPPYIAQDDPHLQQGDVRFEPKIALEAGDGLVALKKIIIQAKEHLTMGGLLMLEHGYDQSEQVQKLLRQNKYQAITPYQDLAGIYRIVVAEKT
ncbi:Release factor glutamine methyltransferase [Gammaproteobacteria bacterium]